MLKKPFLLFFSLLGDIFILASWRTFSTYFDLEVNQK